MPRAIPVAALSLTLLGFLAAVGSSTEVFAPSADTPSASLADPLTQQNVRAERTERTVLSLVRASAGVPLPLPSTPHLSTRPVARPVEPSLRPLARPFWAKGPLVARVSDASFGPHLRPDDLLTPKPPATLAGADDLLCIAVAIYHEARNQPLDGQLAVASVILNRTKEPERWSSSPCEVVTPGQFSFMTGPTTFPPVDEPEAWAIAVEMAREALERGPSALVGQADHYHTLAVQPVWSNEMEPVITIDDHIFFADLATRG